MRQSAGIAVPLDTEQAFPLPQSGQLQVQVVMIPSRSSDLPEAYKLVKNGYDLLEQGNKEIVRKLKPCPKQYKRLALLLAGAVKMGNFVIKLC